MGGFQRLALDQAYVLSESGYSVRILVLSSPISDKEPNFLTIEKDLISNFKIEIVFLGQSRFNQWLNLNRSAGKMGRMDLLLSHTLRGTALLSFQKIRILSRPKLITTIHQLPTLSAPRQRFKRFCYAQFTDVLTGYSEAVRADWIEKAGQYGRFFRFLFRKEMQTLRNGIFLNRLPSINSIAGYQPRIIYLGRSASWKGIDSFFKIASSPVLSNFKFLMMVPNQNDVNLQDIESVVRERFEIVAGKSISSLIPRFGDVHVYPANYGSETNHVESVSLNCLELASLGIPSILSQRGTSTWPDLKKFGIFHESDWKNPDDVANQVIQASLQQFNQVDLEQIRGSISIRNNIEKLIDLSK
jgi:glycosyltransferase involved in cell wall biosynthesis